MATAESIARSYWNAEMARDLAGVMSHYRNDAVLEAPGVHLEGPEVRHFYEESFNAFPKLEVEIGRVLGDERLACLEWHAVFTDLSGLRREANVVEVDGETFISVRAYFDRMEFDIAAESSL
jgi:hypothetical protein